MCIGVENETGTTNRKGETGKNESNTSNGASIPSPHSLCPPHHAGAHSPIGETCNGVPHHYVRLPHRAAAPLTLLKLTPPCRESASMKRRYASQLPTDVVVLCVRRRAESNVESGARGGRAVGRMVGIDGTEWGRGRMVGTRGYAERGEEAQSGE